jgi:predicted signal transduction protein with EAL and GGDEF domain
MTAAQRLRDVVRDADFVARLGGDEFLLVSERLDTIERAQELAERIVKAIAEPMTIDGIRVEVGASVGFVVPSREHIHAGELLRQADLAMYAAKQNGRGRAVAFDMDLGRADLERRSIEREMRDALATGAGLSVKYQPIVNAMTGKVTSVEALLRWNYNGTARSPATFIPLLESSPVIRDVGIWVLHRACRDVAMLRQLPNMQHLSVSVNLSGRHLIHSSAVTDVRDALATSGVPAEALIIEITETAIADLSMIMDHTRQLRQLGVKVAIDDFGTGYTSVSQLTRLPVQTLKVDRSFVDQIHQAASRRIVELIIEVGHTLQLQVVAEGVEDESQQALLRQLGCDSIQGYLYSQPLAIAELTAWMRRSPADRHITYST